MNLGFAFEILREPATPCLDRRLLRLRFMPRGDESRIPPPLEFWGDLGDEFWAASTGTASAIPASHHSTIFRLWLIGFRRTTSPTRLSYTSRLLGRRHLLSPSSRLRIMHEHRRSLGGHLGGL